MKTTLAVQLIIALSLVAWTSPAQEVRPEAASNFKWFSGLGFPEVKDRPYVRIATGQWQQTEDDTRQNQYIKGFLLATDGPTFRAFTTMLSDQTFTNVSDGTNEYNRVGFEILDLRTEAQVLLQSLKNPPAKKDDWEGFGSPLTKQAQTFVMAWACWRQGQDALAEQLYEQAQQLPSKRDRSETTNTFQMSLEKELAFAMIWHAVLCCGDPSIPRPQLLQMFDAIATNYPHSEYHQRAAQTADRLRKMISEDEAHAKTAVTNLEQLPVEAQVQELIFRLRDQNGHQYSQPGSCDIFEDYRRGNNTNTPAHQLVRLGYAAVPGLIAALDDQTMTRSVGYWRNFTFSHNTLTVGDCAEAILQRITGRSFFVPTYTSSYMPKDQKASATRKAAEVWWAEYEKKGEKQMLIEALGSPGNDALGQAKLLCQRFPDVAVPTLIHAILATTNDWIRPGLIRQIESIEDPQVADFLNVEMTNSPLLKSRATAANGLQRKGKGPAVTCMIREWQKLDGKETDSDDGCEEVIKFLASCDSPEAIRALGEGIRQRPVQTRLDVVEAVGGGTWWHDDSLTNSPATQTAIEELLVKELEDTEERTGMSGSRNGRSFVDPRICDMAGELLNERWTNRYAFDISATLKTRNYQRIKCMNVWREARGLALLPFPKEPLTHVTPEHATCVTEIRWSEGTVLPGIQFSNAVSSFKGKDLGADQIVSLLTNYATHPEPKTMGLQFEAIKDDNLTGVTVLVRLLPEKSQYSATECYYSERVILGKKSLLGSYGNGSVGYQTAASGWDDLAKAAAEALAGNPELPFTIKVKFTFETSK